MVHVQNSTLAGGVAVGSVCNMLIGPHGALLIGFISAVISVFGYRYLTVRENAHSSSQSFFLFFCFIFPSEWVLYVVRIERGVDGGAGHCTQLNVCSFVEMNAIISEMWNVIFPLVEVDDGRAKRKIWRSRKKREWNMGHSPQRIISHFRHQSENNSTATRQSHGVEIGFPNRKLMASKQLKPQNRISPNH